MGLGGTAKKLQKVADTAEELYGKLNELRGQVEDVRDAVENTNERVEALETQVTQQRALLEALAEQEGVDVDAVLTETAIDDAETADGAAQADGGDASN